MKQFLNQCASITMMMLIVLIVASCKGFEDIAEASGDVGHRRYTGDSYNAGEADEGDIGFNVAAILMTHLLPKNKATSFLQPADSYRNYQFASAITTKTQPTFRRYQRDRYLLSHSSSDGEFVDHLRLLTGLEFIQKHSKDEGTKIHTNYLQVPIVALYNHDLDDERKVFGGLGPYLAYGIGGKIEGDGFSEKAFDEDFGFKRFDAGLTFTAGYKFHKNWSVRLAYDLGLANIEQDSFDKAKNRCFSVNLGYWPHLIQKLTGK
jgi:hypothetical protein